MSLDSQILQALRETDGDPVSGAELADRTGSSRAAICERIEALRREGYRIVANPHQGYRLEGTADRLLAEDLISRLRPNRVIGRDIRVFQETTSTNDIAEKLARDGAPEGVVVAAESQTRGRGRMGRSWTSPGGKGLWFSVVLRPHLRPVAVTRMTIMTATALVRAVTEQTGLAAEIKWPNDLLVGGRKAAGILTELKAELDSITWVILGIGINVNLDPSDFPPNLRADATSLKIEAGGPVDRPEFAARLLRLLDELYERIRSGRFAAVADEWASYCSTLGRRVTIRQAERQIAGCAESLDSDGALLVRTEHGHLERILSGDVVLEKPG